MKLRSINGNIQKMQADIQEEIQYYFRLANTSTHLNPLLKKKITIKFTHKINCKHCSKLTKKSYAQGYCYKCFILLPETDISIVQPDKDMAHLGISRNMTWAKQNSLQPHYVYLAFTNDIKVGVTRQKNIPIRWIDQGAIAAIKLAKTPNRHIAGVIEVALKKHFSDKTNWAKMLSTLISPTDLIQEKNKAISLLHPELKQYVISDEKIHQFTYPMEMFKEKYKAIQLEKQTFLDEKLVGIKGQYLIFENGSVLNVRRHIGYEINLIHP